MVDLRSQWYPYTRVQDGFFNFRQFATFPRMICDYLIDAPRGDYVPPDDNAYSRCRLWKYLYYDGAKPLESPLPDIEQKMSVLFDPEMATEPPTEKGYRLIPQEYIKQAQTEAQTRIYVYMGRTVASVDDNRFSASVVFDIFTHYTYELNTKADEYSRSGAIAAALIEALIGVNMTGIGTFSMSRKVHPDCGSKPIYDGNANVGRQVIIGLEMAAMGDCGIGEVANMPFGDDNRIRFV